jgi:hypothetical protein
MKFSPFAMTVVSVMIKSVSYLHATIIQRTIHPATAIVWKATVLQISGSCVHVAPCTRCLSQGTP